MYALEPVVRLTGLGDGDGVLYAELLTRPETGQSPASFVETLAGLGASLYLDAYMLSEACALARRGEGAFGVNISRRSLGRWRDIVRRIEREAPDPSLVVLEITESGPDDAGARSRLGAFCREARALGCLIALDDAGAGAHAGEGYARALEAARPHFVKLDRALIARPGEISRHAEMAAAFGAAVIAEGVESEAQAILAASSGAAYGQGWHFSRAPRRRKPGLEGASLSRPRPRYAS